MTSDPPPAAEPGTGRRAGRAGDAELLTNDLSGGWAAEDQVLADHARDAAALRPSPRGIGATGECRCGPLESGARARMVGDGTGEQRCQQPTRAHDDDRAGESSADPEDPGWGR